MFNRILELLRQKQRPEPFSTEGIELVLEQLANQLKCDIEIVRKHITPPPDSGIPNSDILAFRREFCSTEFRIDMGRRDTQRKKARKKLYKIQNQLVRHLRPLVPELRALQKQMYREEESIKKIISLYDDLLAVESRKSIGQHKLPPQKNEQLDLLAHRAAELVSALGYEVKTERRSGAPHSEWARATQTLIDAFCAGASRHQPMRRIAASFQFGDTP